MTQNFDSDTASFTLANGDKFPALGLGTWKIPDDLVPGLIQDAIKIGYCHFDCACDYGNEPAVGAGLKQAFDSGIASRDDLWITSKLWNTYHDPKHVRAACERSLSDLGLDQLDLYLVHFPVALEYVDFEKNYPPGWFNDPDAESPAMKPVAIPYADTWGAMEELQRAGLVKNIGVCNLNISLLRDVLSSASIAPAVHQVEIHPYLTQQRLVRFCHENNIAVTAFSPFGAGSYVPLSMAGADESMHDDPVIKAIAEAHDRTTGQIALRWAVQRGTVPIPKTQTLIHLEENFRIFDFALSDNDMAQLEGLNRNRRFNDPGEFCEAAFNTFYPIFD
jgi:D-xylose reductase